MDARPVVLCALLSLTAGASARGGDVLPTLLPARGFVPRVDNDRLPLPPRKALEQRNEALARARFWSEPPTPIEDADLSRNPGGPGGVDGSAVVCKFQPKPLGGATPKFLCVFEGGDVLKVKYGRDPEIYTEVAATRLLSALGAGADRVYLVKKVRCFGCPDDPEAMLSCISSPSEVVRRKCGPFYGMITDDGRFAIRVNYARYVDFGPVTVERRAPGQEIGTDSLEGWGWDELDRLQARGRAAGRAERDALRLVAVFLDNWDNRPDNQRLLCLPGGARKDGGGCARPFAYMQDVGATFGRAGAARKEQRKMDLQAWKEAPVWMDAGTCRVTITSPALHGATFGEAVISESGRRFLAERLSRLSRVQIRGLFAGSGFGSFAGTAPANRDVDGWVTAFEDKVRQITERAPCPTA